MREIGRRFADGYLKDPPLLAQKAAPSSLAVETALEMTGELATNFPGAQ